MKKNLINHVTYLLDKSGSMGMLANGLVQLFNSEISQQKLISDQEIRISVFLFGEGCECLVFDMDINRVPDLASHYKAKDQCTELVDSTIKVIKDLRKIPELYGDHSHLVNIITDGQDNHCTSAPGELRSILASLPDNWTVSCSVPDSRAKYQAQLLGFAPGNVNVWQTTEQGIKDLGSTRAASVSNYYTNRTVGVRGTKSFYQPDVATLNIAEATNFTTRVLKVIPANEYTIAYNTGPAVPIRELVEKHNSECIRTYGRNAVVQLHQEYDKFYCLKKTETVQPYKRILVRKKDTGVLYDDARNILGIPSGDVKVGPGKHDEWDIYIQSTSVNRKVENGDKVIIMARK